MCCAKGSQTKAGGYRAARRGHKQGRGVIALKKETDKHIIEHLNEQQRGHREGGGLSRCAKGSQTRAGGYRAEERNR